MSDSSGTFTRAERLFQEWLDAFRSGAPDDAERRLAGQPESLRAEVARMIADYERLRERLGDGAPGFEAGRVIGDFRLVRELGRGGMGVVWEAEQLSMKRRVALKLLFPHFTLSETALGRFRREAEAGGRLGHPGVVQVYSVGEADGVHYMAQELVPSGYTLADLLAERREEAELPPGHYADVVRLFESVAQALDYAHAAGVIHRDVKPSNILLAEGDQPKVADFGLAHVDDLLSLSKTGETLGTPYYMSPEQAQTKRTPIDRRTDVFSLGATFYEALTLVRPFDGDTSQQVFEKIRSVDPPDPRAIRSRVPRDLAVICLKALEKEPARRYASMAAFAEDLARSLADEPILARPPGPLARVLKWTRRHRVASSLAGFVAGAIAVLGALLVRTLEAEREAQTARARAMAQSEVALLERTAARRQGYAANLFAAQTLLGANDYAEAHRRLELCPEEMRGWEWGHLSLLADPALAVLSDSEAGVMSVAFSPDGELIATGSTDGTIRLRDARSHEVLRTLSKHRGRVTALAFLPDGRRLVSGSWDTTLGIWDVASGERLAVLEGHERTVTCVAVSPDGARIASGSWDLTARLWDAETGNALATLEKHRSWLRAVAFSPDGSLLLSAASQLLPVLDSVAFKLPRHVAPDEMLVLWDAATGAFLRSLAVESLSIECAVFDPDGRAIVLGTGRGRLVFLDVETGEVERSFVAHSGEVTALAFRADGARLVTGSEDRTVRVFDNRHEAPLVTFRGHEDAVTAVAFSPDGRVVASTAGTHSQDPTLRLWDAWASGPVAVVAVHAGPVSDVAANATAVASAGWDSLVRLYEPSSLDPFASLRADSAAVETVAFASNGRVVTGGREGIVRLWHGATGELLREFAGHPGWIKDVAISPDGTRIASGSNASFERGARTTSLSLSNTPRTWPGLLRVWDADTGALVHRLDGHRIVVGCVAFDPSGRQLASGSIDGTIRIWDAESGAELAVLTGHGAEVNCVVFDPAGARLVSASEDRTLRVWDVVTGEHLATLVGHEDEVLAVAFHPGGSRIASGSKDATVRLWDARSGAALLTLHGHTGDVNGVAFSADGTRLFSGASDRTVRAWESELAGARVAWTAEERRARMNRKVQRLMRDHLLVELAVGRIADDDELDSAERQTAVRLARARGDASPARLLRHAWKNLRDADRASRHAEALTWIEAACAGEPSARNENVRGIGLFRAGSFAVASEVLARAAEGHDLPWPTDERVANAAFQAMTQHHLGERTEAERLLELAREIASKSDAGRLGFLLEAESLIQIR